MGAIVLPPIEVELYAGAQKLVESDKAVTFEGRLRMGAIGVAARFTQFREPVADSLMSTLSLDLWSVAASYRFRVSADIELEPELGVAGLRYAGDGQMPLTDSGGVAGLVMRARLGSSAALVGSGRVFAMSETGNAIEGRVGVAVGPLQLSYRSCKFDAGPALEGPEVGLGFRF